MTIFLSYAFVLLSSTLCYASNYGAVPALLWSPESKSLSHLPEVKGMDPIKTDDFLSEYLSPVLFSPSEHAVVFLQDKLHVDDFTKYANVYSPDSDGGAFKNIKTLMLQHPSLELPQVANPSDAVEKLKSSFSDVYTVNSTQDVEGLNFKKDKRVLIIVHLNSVVGQKDYENAIQQNDATVGAIARHLQKRRVKYNALYTGQSASSQQADSADSFSSRHLLETPEKNGTFMNASDGQIYAYMKEAVVVVKNATSKEIVQFNLTLTENTADNSTYTNDSAEIHFEFWDVERSDKPGTKYTIKIITETKRYKDRWIMTGMFLDISGGDITIEKARLDQGDLDFTVPILYSWHCTLQTMQLDVINNKNFSDYKGTYVSLKGYQLQPYMIQRNRFFDAQDCVPYFTTAIWMFLFCSIFLLTILIFGALMVLSLSTMDKYDDPKGKTITVAQGTD